MKLYCKNCNKKITRNSKSGLCISCCRKGKNNHNFWKKGKLSFNWKGNKAKSRQIYYCIEKDCKNIVSKIGNRCNKCAGKLRKNQNKLIIV